MTVISSTHNDRVKLVRALQSNARARRKAGRIVLEGVRLVTDAVATGAKPDFVLFTADAVQDNKTFAPVLNQLREQGVVCLEVTPAIMEHVADTPSPQGIIAVMMPPHARFPEHPTMILVLDSIADPGNLGTLLRTATAAGVNGVALGPGCTDPFGPKALRAGMGAHFRVPLAQGGWPEISTSVEGLSVYVADPRGETPYFDVDWTQPSALIIGGEAHGAADEARRLASTAISIPMAHGAESLNAAAAAAIILFECRRQRHVQPE